MIIWRGYGILVVLLSIFTFGAMVWAEFHFGLKPQTLLSAFAVITGALLYFIGRRVNSVVDEATQQRVTLGLFKAPHTFFFIPLHYCGVLLAVLFCYVDVTNRLESREHLEFLNAPVIGDIYFVDYAEIIESYPADEFQYGLVKVAQLDEKGLTVSLGQQVFEKRSAVRAAMKQDGIIRAPKFGAGSLDISRDQLVAMYDVGAIYSVKRLDQADVVSDATIAAPEAPEPSVREITPPEAPASAQTSASETTALEATASEIADPEAPASVIKASEVTASETKASVKNTQS
uniref:hypothetical protein n=1 Tax=Thaumasiovibrio occultus TaxID=1891184 RepID=UPI000B35B752|nr:hypothetical protein [Thaumasiovibrio occultus]